MNVKKIKQDKDTNIYHWYLRVVETQLNKCIIFKIVTNLAENQNKAVSHE